MPSSAAERELDRLHLQFLGVVERMLEQGTIDKDQRDKLIDLLEHIDEYSQGEFERAWNEIVGLGETPRG